MRKFTLLLLVAILFVTICFPSSAIQENTKNRLLSEMSEDECMQFLLESGVEIPEELKNYNGLGKFVKQTITTVENDPDHFFFYNYIVTLQFSEEIKKAVNNYYGNMNGATTYASSSDGGNSLKFNTLYGEWLDEYSTYNCYAYAIGYTNPQNYEDPHFYPGYFNPKTRDDFNIDDTVAQMAALTASDLMYLGHSCVTYSTDYEDILQYADTSNIICLRKMTYDWISDFHYMKFSNSKWLHKPGITHVLKLNSQAYENAWYAEAVNKDGQYIESGVFYTGTIYYFAYKDSHTFTSREYTSENYHDGKYHYFQYLDYCADCQRHFYGWEKVSCSGPPCQVAIMQITPETHYE